MFSNFLNIVFECLSFQIVVLNGDDRDVQARKQTTAFLFTHSKIVRPFATPPHYEYESPSTIMGRTLWHLFATTIAQPQKSDNHQAAIQALVIQLGLGKEEAPFDKVASLTNGERVIRTIGRVYCRCTSGGLDSKTTPGRGFRSQH